MSCRALSGDGESDGLREAEVRWESDGWGEESGPAAETGEPCSFMIVS
jgi:hypothetical protein